MSRLVDPAYLLVLVVLCLPVLLGCTSKSRGSDTEVARVEVVDREGKPKARVVVRVARTPSQRYRGLSGTESLPEDGGMLFVYAGEDTRSFVMREMNYPLDILFIGEHRRVVQRFEAPTPPPDTPEHGLVSYRARARWVLEVNRGWSRTHDVKVGDRVRFQGLDSTGDG